MIARLVSFCLCLSLFALPAQAKETPRAKTTKAGTPAKAEARTQPQAPTKAAKGRPAPTSARQAPAGDTAAPKAATARKAPASARKAAPAKASVKVTRISYETPALVLGRGVDLAVSGKKGRLAGIEVKAVYYPKSEVAQVRTIGRTNVAGVVRWKPEFAGLVQLVAGQKKAAKKTLVSVRYTGLPISGLVVFLVASLILIGGLVFGASRVFAADE